MIVRIRKLRKDKEGDMEIEFFIPVVIGQERGKKLLPSTFYPPLFLDSHMLMVSFSAEAAEPHRGCHLGEGEREKCWHSKGARFTHN